MGNRVYCYERMEFKVDTDVTYMKFIYADGTEKIAYSFDKQPVFITYDKEGIEHIAKNGEVQKCIRYTPVNTGTLVAEMYAGERMVNSLNIDVVPSENHGYIKVSETDRRYFEYSDGTPCIPIGINMVYPTTYLVSDGTEFGQTTKVSYIGLNQYRSWFKKLQENGANIARLWLGHRYFNPDTENAYELDLVQFSKIDEIVEIAREYDIKLKLTLEQFENFNYSNQEYDGSYSSLIFNLFNKKLYVNGKRCEHMSEWLTDKDCMAAWLFKVNEFAKRYSGDTAIFAIELWNEMSGVLPIFEDVAAWNEIYLPKVREMFPDNLVVNSLGSFDSDCMKEKYTRFCWDKCDFRQIHRYLDQGAPYECCSVNPIEFLSDAMQALKSKEQPLIIAETGAVDKRHSGPFKYYSADDDGLFFADCVYTPFFCESAGCGQIWHWDNRYVESKSLLKMFKPFSTLVKDIDAANENFVSKDLSDNEAYIFVLEGKNYVLGYIRNKTSDWSKLLRDLKEVSEIEELSINIGDLREFELIKIWNDNASGKYADGKVLINDIHHGVMFKAKKVG